MCEQTFCDCYFDNVVLKLVSQFYAKHIHLIHNYFPILPYFQILCTKFVTIQTVIEFNQKLCKKWRCIKKDQIWYIKERHTGCIIRNAIKIYDYCESNNYEVAFISMDFETVFDSIDIQFPLAVLQNSTFAQISVNE